MPSHCFFCPPSDMATYGGSDSRSNTSHDHTPQVSSPYQNDNHTERPPTRLHENHRVSKAPEAYLESEFHISREPMNFHNMPKKRITDDQSPELLSRRSRIIAAFEGVLKHRHEEDKDDCPASAPARFADDSRALTLDTPKQPWLRRLMSRSSRRVYEKYLDSPTSEFGVGEIQLSPEKDGSPRYMRGWFRRDLNEKMGEPEELSSGYDDDYPSSGYEDDGLSSEYEDENTMEPPSPSMQLSPSVSSPRHILRGNGLKAEQTAASSPPKSTKHTRFAISKNDVLDSLDRALSARRGAESPIAAPPTFNVPAKKKGYGHEGESEMVHNKKPNSKMTTDSTKGEATQTSKGANQAESKVSAAMPCPTNVKMSRKQEKSQVPRQTKVGRKNKQRDEIKLRGPGAWIDSDTTHDS